VARLPDEVVERIRQEVSVQRLAEARGIKLRRVGKNLIGLCPFHKDSKPSLSITPSTNKWHCLGCGKGGTAIDWVMAAQGVSLRHALEILSRDLLPMSTSAAPPPKKSTVPKLPPLIEKTPADKRLLKVVVDYYHEALKQSPEAQQYLLKRGLRSAEMLEHFRLGFSNRTLGYRLPASNRVAGAEQRERLKQLGILKNQKPGHEHFRGSIVIPILNLDGEVVQMYGRKITPAHQLREGTPDHLYLPGPLRGVWNERALLLSKEIILCESLIDALTFWCAGYRHVTTIYGVNNFTAEIRAAFQGHGTKRIYIAYDPDEAGERAAQEHSKELLEMGIECLRVKFPRGQDANEFAVKNQPATKFLGMYLNSALWLGKGQRPAVSVPQAAVIEETATETTTQETSIEEEASADVKKEIPATAHREKPAAKEKSISPDSEPGPRAEIPIVPAKQESTLPAGPKLKAERILPEAGKPVFSLAAIAESVPREEAPQEQRPMPLEPPPEVQVKMENEEITITISGRAYRIRGLEKATSNTAMRVNVFVAGENARGELCYHGDTFDMNAARQRMLFVKQAAHELAAREDIIGREVGKVWMELEKIQREMIQRTLQQEEEKPAMTEEEKAAALDLLRDPRLMERVLEDFDKCGVVGEETNKKIGYLAAVSRLLKKPLAVIVQSASSAGKSSLMEAVLNFIPEDQREEYTAMTGQSLFYMGEKDLKHKILAISEQQGAEAASYPLKLLQSEGKLKIASTSKDPVSGRHVSHEYKVEGPVMIFLTTTAQNIDEEMLNRAIVLTVNEEREQTRAIHQKQREAQTLEGMWAEEEREDIANLHRNAQRLLRPLRVANNYDLGEFPSAMTRARRDHSKFLTLIQAIALLHQQQREIKSSTRNGKTLEYIEATEADVRLAEELRDQVIQPSLEDLPPQARTLLSLIEQLVKQEAERQQIEPWEYRFTRRALREFTRWGDTQLRLRLQCLVEMEYLRVRHGGGQGQLYVYQLPEQHFAVRGHFAGGSRAPRGDGKSEESPATTRESGETSRFSESISTEAPAQGDQNRVIAVTKPNGAAATQPKPTGAAKPDAPTKAAVKRAGVK
jgi:DNA primase catalytic core